MTNSSPGRFAFHTAKAGKSKPQPPITIETTGENFAGVAENFAGHTHARTIE
tara:strand:+ start:19041 stop:19196 length:156 start_codon:yes stop_codon:yes gene_type:complete